MKGGNGEFYVYVKKGKNNQIVFSNNPAHKCVIGEKISPKNLPQIIEKIETLSS